MATTIVITTNVSQATDVTIRDMGIIIPNSGGSETFTDLGNLTDSKNSRDLRTLATDNAYGAGSSTLIITDGTNAIDQGELDAFLESLGETRPTDWGMLAADPTTTPNDGDRYYNTSIKKTMIYDSSRSKWLSEESFTLIFGRGQGNVGDGAFFRTVDRNRLTLSNGWPAMFDGTVVGLAYTRDDSDSATFEVIADSSTIATLASSATSGFSNSLNGDFDQGDVITFRNQAGGNNVTDPLFYATFKWRST